MMPRSIRNYFRRIAEGYEHGVLSRVLYPLLFVLAKIYGQISSTLRFLHEKKILTRKRLPFPVVSVGNITWGGTGKTPFVEYLARKVNERHRTPLILTRGYNHDEVEQFRAHTPGALLGVGRQRWKVALELKKKNHIDLGILDDGLQHWAVDRDIEIIMLNALNPFGNGNVIPCGILREPLVLLKRAAIIVLSHVNLVPAKDLIALKEQIKKLAPDAFIVESYLEPLFFYRAKKRSRVHIQKLENHRVATFSAVGAPRSFQLLLSHSKIKPIRNFEFTDHHVFSRRELEEIKELSQSSALDEIITTEKDFYRCPGMISDILNPLVLATRLRIASGEEVLTDRLFHLLGVTLR